MSDLFTFCGLAYVLTGIAVCIVGFVEESRKKSSSRLMVAEMLRALHSVVAATFQTVGFVLWCVINTAIWPVYVWRFWIKEQGQ